MMGLLQVAQRLLMQHARGWDSLREALHFITQSSETYEQKLRLV